MSQAVVDIFGPTVSFAVSSCEDTRVLRSANRSAKAFLRLGTGRILPTRRSFPWTREWRKMARTTGGLP
jgi:hypothetical protein